MRPKGLEPPAHCLEGSFSIHLSYGRTLLSHGVLIWRQCAFGTRCEKYNTIRIGFCQAEFQIFLDFPAQGAFWGHSRYIPAAPRAKPSRAPAATLKRPNKPPVLCRKTGLRRAFLRKYDVLQKEKIFLQKTLDNFGISGIITIVPSDTAHEQNRICGYGGIGRRVRFRF